MRYPEHRGAVISASPRFATPHCSRLMSDYDAARKQAVGDMLNISSSSSSSVLCRADIMHLQREAMQAGAHACVLASHVPPACLPCSGNPAAGTGGGDAHALRAFGMKALSHMALDAVQVVALIGAVAGGTLSFFFVLEGERHRRHAGVAMPATAVLPVCWH